MMQILKYWNAVVKSIQRNGQNLSGLSTIPETFFSKIFLHIKQNHVLRQDCPQTMFSNQPSLKTLIDVLKEQFPLSNKLEKHWLKQYSDLQLCSQARGESFKRSYHMPHLGSSCQSIYLWCVSCSVVSNSLQPHGLRPAKLLCPWNSPGMNTGVDCRSILQRIFLPFGGRFFTIWATGEAFHLFIQLIMQPWQRVRITSTAWCKYNFLCFLKLWLEPELMKCWFRDKKVFA